MSKTVYDATLLELIPENLRGDPDIIAASQAVDEEFCQMSQTIKNCLTFADIDNARSDVVDMLAGELNVDFYDQSLPLPDRREAVKAALEIKQYNGTKEALLRIFELLSMRGVIEEWFEYGGDPYTFKITILEVGNRGLTTETNAILDRLISIHKNARSWLTELNIYLTTHGKVPVYATGVMFGEEITVYPWNVTSIESSGKRYMGIGYQAAETIDIYPL